jgi:hypothetical protein
MKDFIDFVVSVQFAKVMMQTDGIAVQHKKNFIPLDFDGTNVCWFRI